MVDGEIRYTVFELLCDENANSLNSPIARIFSDGLVRVVTTSDIEQLATQSSKYDTHVTELADINNSILIYENQLATLHVELNDFLISYTILNRLRCEYKFQDLLTSVQFQLLYRAVAYLYRSPKFSQIREY